LLTPRRIPHEVVQDIYIGISVLVKWETKWLRY
jgi:hypothetical protein